jgi:hypothetical protein
VAHVDETGMRVAGKSLRLHVMCTATLTRDFVRAKRCRGAVEAFDLLLRFHSTLVRDHWVGHDVSPFSCRPQARRPVLPGSA